ncbi:MAG TPA: NAD(P)/FAD-dependent oxidoreductase [Microbacteriaceae bacterium]|jgi:cation diffusion facilitator CzcD-associated flavoprotein CzcO|nr:NAD(P)/FAD-dependent oxidoreductase [Microbacteriaceae bacterium]HQZ47782.1 NAD(P)/FAD-dependent oxidoreductase [Microbacteriaceae bacterium]HRA08471.1 NAD(P)/FAD-dependent oxidoreductase [Microbacteriaceae bacterium]
MSNTIDPIPTYDVVVIGAGFAGIYLVHKLRDDLGLDVKVFERGAGIGGTWYWNRYPGARCDLESDSYSLSFNDEIEQEWNWTERYASQPEILRYVNFVADKLDVRGNIELNTTVTGAVFDEGTDTWTVTTDTGASARARYLVSATGILSVPSMPTFEGMDTFAGEIYHTGDWPHEGVDFTGKRVAVIGTGSSGIQSIPVIAEEAASVTVFQRTATFTVPAANRPMTENERKATKRSYKQLREQMRRSQVGVLLEPGIGNFADVDLRVVRGELERRWRGAGMSTSMVLSDNLRSIEANNYTSQFVRDKINEIVDDPAVAKMLEPHDYPIGTKRLPIDTNYYDTFNRDHVSLVSIRDTPIERFSPAGIVVDGREHEFDAIVLATGFDAATGALDRIQFEGVDGRLMKDEWAEGAKSYLGLASPGFPNFFTVTGPGSPAILTNVIGSIEHHVEWIADYISYLRAAGITRTEATPEATERWTTHVAELAAMTLYPTAASWYMGANVPGKPRVFLAYIGGLHNYRDRCEKIATDGYPGFTHDGGTGLAARAEAVAAEV